jgi:hypothetical protein
MQAPNTALQRTRLRAPLSFEPLGSKTLALIVAVGALACSASILKVGVLGGFVTDSEGHPLPGVTITASRKSDGLKRVVTTGLAGRYSMPNLPTGKYSVSAELEGFRQTEPQRIRVRVGRDTEGDFMLTLAPHPRDITITSGHHLIIETRQVPAPCPTPQ